MAAPAMPATAYDGAGSDGAGGGGGGDGGEDNGGDGGDGLGGDGGGGGASLRHHTRHETVGMCPRAGVSVGRVHGFKGESYLRTSGCPASGSTLDHPKVAGDERHGECPRTTGTE